MQSRFLDPVGLARVGNMELVARQVVEGFLTGRHRSPYHGFSVEFLDHRAYTPGDDLRNMDWKIVARSNKYYVKLFEDETNLRAYVLLDCSRTPIENQGIIAGAADDRHVLAGMPVTLRPRIVNFSTNESAEVPVSVLAGDEEVARKKITVEPGQSAEVELIYTPRAAGIQRLRYEIPDDRFAADNVYRCTLSVSSEVNVLLVNGHPSSDPLEDRGLFLRSALTIDQDQIQSLRVREVRQLQLDSEDLSDFDVLILADCCVRLGQRRGWQ